MITNTIRILSDTFDTAAINKNPSSAIGRAFNLGRLVLVAPDIPIETIMLRRANFLRSSLRRCEEVYVFSNKGDITLRIASTAANYFSFPARTRSSGYRLGNVTVRHFENKEVKFSKFPEQGYRSEEEKVSNPPYGIVNPLLKDPTQDDPNELPYIYLEIRASNTEYQSLEDIRPIDTIQEISPLQIYLPTSIAQTTSNLHIHQELLVILEKSQP